MTPAARDFWDIITITLLIPLACLAVCYGARLRITERDK